MHDIHELPAATRAAMVTSAHLFCVRKI